MNFESWLAWEKKDLIEAFWDYPRKNALRVGLIVLMLTGGLFGFKYLVSSGRFIFLDFSFLERAVNFDNQFIQQFFSFITLLGTRYFVSGIAFLLAVVLFVNKRKRAALVVLTMLLVNFASIYFLKVFFARLRPLGCFGFIDDCFSFPSGHAAVALYFYGLLWYLGGRFLGWGREMKTAGGIGFIVLIGLIGLSRIYLGLHFPSDILAGLLVGGIWLLVGIVLIDFFYQRT